MVGRTLDRYQLLEQVGQGGMAVVYRALDVPLNREVAVKVLHPHLADQPESRARLQREARAVARLRHENILEIFAYSGIHSAESYLVTEFIHGPTLRAFLSAHSLGLPEIGAMIASELSRALQCAHDLGIIHRDIKPENVMIREDGTVVLCDFGIAQVVDKERMTATGQLLGSPAYMAPEHIEGQPLDCRSDVFSLGVMLYELVCGELPFRGRNPHETLRRITDGRFAPPEEKAPLCSAGLSRIISKALARDPAARYAEAAALRKDLLLELKECGVGDPRAELCAFFKEPEIYLDALRPRLLQALKESGARLRERGRTAAALSTWSRALLLSPSGQDAEVRALIRAVEQRGRWRRWAAMAAGAAAALGMAQGIHHGVRGLRRAGSGPEESGGGVTRATQSGPLQGGMAADLGAMREMGRGGDMKRDVDRDLAGPGEGERPDLAPVRSAAPPPGPARVSAPRHPVERERERAPRRVVRLAPWPKAVRVSLNGQPLGDYGAEVTSVELREGPNELLFENPACYSERVVIPADASPGEVRLRLRWKPALLLVKVGGAAGAEADVVVEGRIGRPGQVLALPLRSDDGRATVEVKVSAPGQRTETRTIEVRANQLSTVELSLTPQ
jgi:serine/threonine-protein kinase